MAKGSTETARARARAREVEGHLCTT